MQNRIKIAERHAKPSAQFLTSALSARGFTCKSFDIAPDPFQVIFDDTPYGKLTALVNPGRVTMIWLGVPCNTWSRARRPGSGPPPLRSDNFVMGYPDLKGASYRKVRFASRSMYRVAELVLLCISCAVDYVLENPAGLRLWLSKPFKQFGVCSSHSELDFGKFVEPWRKIIALMTNIYGIECLRKLCGPVDVIPPARERRRGASNRAAWIQRQNNSGLCALVHIHACWSGKLEIRVCVCVCVAGVGFALEFGRFESTSSLEFTTDNYVSVGVPGVC